tara:strand:- start:1325 stop:1804 length:480 start_codon:yes stop_codon:yes gene_type:complete
MIQKLLICKILAKRNIMIKKICLVFIFILLSNISNASKKIDLQKQIQSFSWNKRIVLFITKGKYIHFINEVDDFFKKYKCENEIRNLEFIKIVGDEVNDYIFPDKYKNKYGIWLIGYDGQVKGHSKDISLLKKIHNLIDKMPIRKREMVDSQAQNVKCN